MKMKKVAVLLMLAILVIGFVGCNSPTEYEEWFHGEQISKSISNNGSVDHGYHPSILAPIVGILLSIGVLLLSIGSLLTNREMKKLKARIDELEKKVGDSVS
jgi:NADH:ubiquinone oxidoreductase subunit 5 (subunit L)/multisubunit Na+/H+ antiporter MnhA subunit